MNLLWTPRIGLFGALPLQVHKWLWSVCPISDFSKHPHRYR